MRINCFADCRHMAGTVMTQWVSSAAMGVVVCSLSSLRQHSLKYLSACVNTTDAGIFFPLAASNCSSRSKCCMQN